VTQLRFYSSVFAVFSVSGLVGFAIPAMPSAHADVPTKPAPDQIVQSAGSVIYVNPTSGNDNASGQAQSPLKTITVALDRATPSSTIVLTPGTYSIETGEVFPIQLKPGVAIQGDPRNRGQNIIIRGGDIFLSRSFARQNVTIVGANRATLAGVTVTNPDPVGYGLWAESSSPLVVANTFTGSGHDGAFIVGNSTPILRNNYFYQNGASGITIYGTARPELQENIFERTGFGVNIAQNAAPKLIGNRITQNKDGIVIQGSAQPILRNNVIDSNDRDGIVAIAQSRPDLGTSTDPGNNTFLSNRQFDINAQRNKQTLSAFGNQISARTSGGLDLSGASSTPALTTNVASSAAFGQSQTSINRIPIAVNRATQIDRSFVRPTSLYSGANTESAGIEIPVPAPLSDSVPVTDQPTARSAFPRPMVPIQNVPTARSAFPRPMVPGQSTALPIVQSGYPHSTLPAQRARIARSAFPRQVAPLQMNTMIQSAPVSIYQNAVPAYQPRRANSLGILPVPRVAPPIGNTSGTSVRVWRGGQMQSAMQASSVSQAANLGFRFRVIVRANTDSEQAQVRSMVPDAFSLRGRNVMQAGAFRDRAEADELLQMLSSQGLQALIEQI